MTAGPLRRILGIARRAADPTDDAGLLARFAANGDADAFELLVWRHGGMVFGVARRILGDVHAAEDTFQATFLALARQAKSVRKDGCVAAWLHRVARRVAMRAKKASGVRQPPGFQNSRNLGPDAPHSPENPLAIAERRELSQVLDEELDRLPERFRRPVVLCYLEGRSTAEAAERLGCPRGTVLSRLATAREKLRVRLLRRGVAPAILPPLIGSLGVMHGGLTSTAVRAAVANSATPQVIDLCDGVLKAMILSKLKMTATVVLTLGLIGGGAGWMALTPGGPGSALADGPQAKAAVPQPDAAQEQQRRAEEQVLRLHVELAKAQDQLTEQEEVWAKERIDARLRLAEAEERYKQLEGKFAVGVSDPDVTRMEEANKRFNDTRARMDQLRKQSVNGDKTPALLPLRQQMAEEEGQLKDAQAKYAKRQETRAAELLRARREIVTAEEHLSLLDRLTALKRRAAQAQVEDLQDRLGQLRGAAGRPDPLERKVKDLDRKLDDVLRELTELRRELRK